MPVFEYTCKACSEIFALLRWATDDKDIACPRCGSKDVKKLPSAFSCSSADSGSSSGGSYSGGFTGGG